MDCSRSKQESALLVLLGIHLWCISICNNSKLVLHTLFETEVSDTLQSEGVLSRFDHQDTNFNQLFLVWVDEHRLEGINSSTQFGSNSCLFSVGESSQISLSFLLWGL